MKTVALLLSLAFGCLLQGLKAQTSILLPLAGALAGQTVTKDKPLATRLGVAAGLGLAAGWLGNYEADKQAKRDYLNVQKGRYQEAWLRNNTDWYQSTMDRRSGLPPAFDGHWGMYSGLPELERELVKRRMQMPIQSVPASRDEYLAYLKLDSASLSAEQRASDETTAPVPVSTAIMPKRTVNGVTYRPQTRQFPRLP